MDELVSAGAGNSGTDRSGAGKIALVVSDIDGTLVTPSKQLTPRCIAAAHALRRAGLALSLVSSRPPAGFSFLTAPLGLVHPIGAFNGGALLEPDLKVIEQSFVPPRAVAIALEIFKAFAVEPWLYTNETWFVLDLDGAYVAKERHTIQAEPVRVAAFESYYGHTGKLVGSSKDFGRLAECEAELQNRLGGLASARRSQSYYLDVTPGEATKGHAATRIASLLGVPMSQVAVIGDAANDLSMFAVAGLAIAMGNATEEVKQAAHIATASNQEDGFAAAIERIILPRA